MNTEASTGKGKRKKTLLFAGSVLLLILGITAILGGATVLYLNAQTDAEGYTISPVYQVRSSASAFVLWVAPLRTGTFGWLGEDNIAQTKWVIKAADGGKEVFAGWVTSADVATYVTHFGYETADPEWDWYVHAYYAKIDVPSTKIVNQGNPARPPSAEGFWIQSATTSDQASIYWDPTWEQSEGMKVIMLMNADGSSGINADLQLGFKVPILTWLPYLLIPLGLVLCIGGYLVYGRKKHIEKATH
jgi:hypothetical protein